MRALRTSAWPTLAYERNEFDTALRHVTEGIPLCRQFVYTPPLAAGLATLAWIRQANGDPDGALEAIGQAEQAAPGPDVTGLLNPVPAQRARLLLAQGEVAAAARWTKERGLGPDDEPDYPREREYLVLARVLLAQDRPSQALALLERLHAAAAAQDRTGSVIEIQALQALALAASRRRGRCGGRPGLGAHPGLPAGLRPGVRRRGRADGRAAGPAGRGPAGRARPPPAASRSATWPGCCRRSAARTPCKAPGEPSPRRCRAWSSS